MAWQILIAVFLLLTPPAFLLRRQLAKTYPQHDRVVNGLFFIGFLLPAALILAIIDQPNLNIGWLNFWLLLLASGVFPFSTILSYRANRNLDVGLFTILTNLAPVTTIITAWWLLGEDLTDRQLLGAALVLISTFLITSPLLAHRRASRASGIAYAISAVTILGLATTFERYMLTRMDFGAYLVYGWGAQSLWMAVLMWPDRGKLKLLRDNKFAKPVIGYGLANIVRAICFVGSLRLSGNASLVSAYVSFGTVLVVLAGYHFLKEKDWLWFKVGSTIVGVSGMVILNT